MSKAILMSIRPEWCALICEGKKNVEVRKSRPKVATPFKVYIYETKGFQRAGNEDYNFVSGGNGRGKVIGEFICDRTWNLDADSIGLFIKDGTRNYLSENGLDACMDWVDVVLYAGCVLPLYGWHISDLIVYDKPKEPSVFTGLRKTKFGYEPIPARPPQSWCYVEELT